MILFVNFLFILFDPGNSMAVVNKDQYEISAKKHDIDVQKLRALAAIESSMHHACKKTDKICVNGVVASRSKKPAIGEMQVKQDTASDRKCGSLFDRDANIECGARQLAWLREKYCGDNWECLIGSYHDGGRGWRNKRSSAGKRHVKKFFNKLGNKK